MTRMIAIAFLTCIPLLLPGCSERTNESGSILGPTQPTAAGIQVSIAGPLLILEPGFYEWTADVRGAEADVQYRWTLEVMGETTEARFVDGPVLTLTLGDEFVEMVHIQLAVESGGRVAYASHFIPVCGGEQPVDWCGYPWVVEPDPGIDRALTTGMVAR
jgi:hypothetical protein